MNRSPDPTITLINEPLPKATRGPIQDSGNTDGKSDKTLKELLIGPKPVIKTPKGFYASRKVRYSRDGGPIPFELTSGNLPHKAISVLGYKDSSNPSQGRFPPHVADDLPDNARKFVPTYENYEGPQFDVIVQGDSVRIRSEDTSKTVEPGGTGQIRLHNETVLVRFPEGEQREIHDPRLTNVPKVKGKTRKVTTTTVEEIEVEPVVKINNIGYAQVFST